MRFLVVLPIFVFLTAGCGARQQQERINAAQHRLVAAMEHTDAMDQRVWACRSKLLDAEAARQPDPCDMTAAENALTEAINAQNAAYTSLEALPGAPAETPPLDPRELEHANMKREFLKDSYASDCDRGQPSACIQYQQALQQDRDREMQEHEDFERSLQNPVIIVPMY